ncbi:hypothetical protein C8Q70DRAFT_917783 [Cubamyces menziesii]|nr:hypothetical protein C8Q70DRAFT_917783 [Cubamyces menziesii]
MRLVQSRVVGYLMLYPPSSESLRTVTMEVDSCNGLGHSDPLQAIYNLGAMYLSHLIILFKGARGRTPAPSDHSSRPSFDRLREDCLNNPQPSPRDHSSAKASALVRDNFRCMITGKVDWGAVRRGLTDRQPREVPAFTRCCHIFPESLGNISRGSTGSKEHETATVWTTLHRFGYKDICEELGAATTATNLHRLENILTLDPFVHQLFDMLHLWFEAVEGQPNVYNVALAPDSTHEELFLPKTVRFASHRPGLPLPNPRYLQIHAACCRIAHMSGAAEFLDSVYQEMEELRVLAEDGASADVLTVAIHRRLADPG